MKKLAVISEQCIACNQCVEACSQTFFNEKDAGTSAIQITKGCGEGYCIIACSQCGVCIDLCPVDAISRDRAGVVRIKKNICTGCLSCVGFCPESAMRHQGDMIAPFKCVACGQCVGVCPTEALSIEE